MAALVNEKAQSAPFRGAFHFRGGDATEDPLRRAAVLTIALALEDVRTVRRSVPRSA
jgi:hypothetical protein